MQRYFGRLVLVAAGIGSSRLVGAQASPADSSCVAALDSMLGVFRRDYPGYRDKVGGHEAALDALTDSVRTTARTSDAFPVCIPALQRYARFFRDPHIAGPWQSGPPTPPQRTASAAKPDSLIADDPNRPSLRWTDDGTAILRLPDFALKYRRAIDSVIDSNRQRLGATTQWIIDVRGNGGGCSCSYASLSPFLYSRPFSVAGSDVLASRANAAYFRDLLAADLPEADKARIRWALSRMDAHPGEFVELSPAETIHFDSVYVAPRKVGIIVDGHCASSCEGFVIEARQSRKVTVFGRENTSGVGDYGNVRAVQLPGWRQLRLPTSRSRGAKIDNVGLEPEVRIPSAEPDVVGFVRRFLIRYVSPAR